MRNKTKTIIKKHNNTYHEDLRKSVVEIYAHYENFWPQVELNGPCKIRYRFADYKQKRRGKPYSMVYNAVDILADRSEFADVTGIRLAIR